MILRHLVYLDALARERHFRRAAEACHVSQPTLSAAIAQLESEMGVALVKRGRSFEGLTQEGEAVLLHARRILDESEALRQTLRELAGGIGGRLKLGAIPTALPMVGQITAPFSRRYPSVALTVLSLTSHEILQRLQARDLDVGLTYLDNEPLEGVISKPIYRETYVLLTREDGPLGKAETISWAEAARQKLCLLTPDMQNRRIIDGVFRSVGQVPQAAMETNSIFNLCTHAGLEGLCSIVSTQLLAFFGAPKGVKALMLTEPDATHTVGLVIADHRLGGPLAKALLATSKGII